MAVTELKDLERPRGGDNPWTGVRVVTPENPHCTAARHNPTDTTWRIGCRCPGAVKAHEDYNRLRVLRREALRRALVARQDGQCGAAVHDTLRAFRAGCRCEEAVRKEARARALRAERERKKAEARLRSARYAVGMWRGGKALVDRLTLDALIAGYRPTATYGEIVAAHAVLSRRTMPDGPICRRPIGTAEIAVWLGIGDRELHRALAWRRDRADRRTSRRYADSRLRAETKAAATEGRPSRRG